MEILNKRISGSFTDSEDGYNYDGSFQQDENEVLKQFSCTVTRDNPSPELEPPYVGEIISYQRGGKISLTYNGFDATIIGEIADKAERLVEELGGEIYREETQASEE